MKIVLAGGSGQVGTILARAFWRTGDEVVVLSRKTRGKIPPPNARVVWWDARNPGPWTKELEGAEAVINLAGRSVNCRYDAANRRAIMDSRVHSAAAIARALREMRQPPRVWLQASTATIYAHRYDAANDELNGIIGGHETHAPETWRFSIEVAKAWEEAAVIADPLPQTRRVLLRSALTLSPDAGGIFDMLASLMRMGLSGRAGDGRQYVSWIHETDFVRAISWLLEHDQLSGVVNLAAPHPLPNAEFIQILREQLGARVGLSASRWMLEVGAFFLRTETELIIKSRRVVPAKLEQDGFVFQFPHWSEAAQELAARWRRGGERV